MTSNPIAFDRVAERPATHTASAVVAWTTAALLTSAGWAAVSWEAARAAEGGGALWAALCRPLGAESSEPAFGRFALVGALWIAMTAAMMLPAAAGAAAGHAARRRDRFAAPSFILGYLALWSAVALVLAGMQEALTFALSRAVLPERAAGILAGAAVGFAGLYQFTPMKEACLAACRMPVRGGDDSVPGFRRSFATGTAYATSCIGCCGAMMGMMVAAGAMNLVWMAIFAALMTAERLATSPHVHRAVGFSLVAAGLALGIDAVGAANILARFVG